MPPVVYNFDVPGDGKYYDYRHVPSQPKGRSLWSMMIAVVVTSPSMRRVLVQLRMQTDNDHLLDVYAMTWQVDPSLGAPKIPLHTFHHALGTLAINSEILPENRFIPTPHGFNPNDQQHLIHERDLLVAIVRWLVPVVERRQVIPDTYTILTDWIGVVPPTPTLEKIYG